LGSLLIFLQRLKPAISKLASSWSLPRPIIKSHPEEKWGVALSYGSSSKFGSFNISVTAGDIAFKFGMQLGFAKAHHINNIPS